MASGTSTLILWALASLAIAAAWIASARSVWTWHSPRRKTARLNWRLPASGLALGLGAVASAVYRDLPMVEYPLIWETQLARLGWLLLALAPPVLGVVISSERADRG